MDKRVESLIKTLERNHHRWTETIKGRMGDDEIISADMTEEERKLMELLSNAPTEEVTIKRDEIISTDITDQFEKPDHHIIIEEEVDIPKPQGPGGGIAPTVDQWEEVENDVNIG